MIIPLPERFPVKYVVLFATTLFFAQLAAGTEVIFSLLTFAYILIFAAAFNASGGIYYPSGAFIFFNGFLTAVLGLTYKAVLFEPAQSHLLAPNMTMSVYCVGMASFGICGYLARLSRPRRGLLENTSRGAQLKQTAIGCLIVGVVLQFAPLGAVQSIVAQLNHFPRMAVILGTVYAIESTNGRRSSNWIVWVAGIYLTALGLAYFSKEGIFMALTTWIVPTIVLRYNFSKFQLLGGAAVIFFGLYYLVPYSQYGRVSRDEGGSLAVNASAGLKYLSNLEETRKLYVESQQGGETNDAPHLFDSDQGLFDRLQMLAFDDALIKYTLDGNQVGLLPTWAAIYNSVPHFLWANKPTYVSGNVYGREIGVIDSEDTTTGISFSPFGDGFHQVGWFGIIFLVPLTAFPLFYVADALSGDGRKAPWGLLYISRFVHVAPEGLLSGIVYTLVYGTEGVLFITLLARYVLPVLASLFLGSKRAETRRPMEFRPIRRSESA